MRSIVLILFSFFFVFNSLAFDESTLKDMPFLTAAEYCLKCHTREEALSFRGKTQDSCSIYCATCHDDLGSHHPVDLYVTGQTPPDIRLLNNKIECFTCHDLKKKRQDTRSWKAQSLFESLFQDQELYKTYFLVVPNDDGQLCKKCH